jgi:hypothetical protein
MNAGNVNFFIEMFREPISVVHAGHAVKHRIRVLGIVLIAEQ